MITSKYFRTLACSTLTLLPLVALGCGDDPESDKGPGMTVDPAMMPGGPVATAGSAAPPVTPTAGSPSTPPTDPNDPPVDEPVDPADPEDPPVDPNAYPDLRGKCGLNTGFPDDDACISAPSAEEGFQIHVGPSDYTDQAELDRFALAPGQEVTACYTLQLPNQDKDVFYQTNVFSGREGTHHVISNYAAPGSPLGGFMAGCPTPLGTLPGAPRAYVPRFPVAPEYADVGYRIPAGSVGTFDIHYFNYTDGPILREFWQNFYTMDPADMKREALQMRGYGGLSWSAFPIAPGTDQVYQYSHPFTGNGYVMTLLGHYHSHGKRFTAYITRNGSTTPEKVYETFDYQDPLLLHYNSVTENPPFAEGQAGAVSGILEVKDGDVLSWECHVVNDGMVGLTYSNDVKNGEMCNMWGYSVGISDWDVNIF
jgi:hypothetical protein